MKFEQKFTVKNSLMSVRMCEYQNVYYFKSVHSANSEKIVYGILSTNCILHAFMYIETRMVHLIYFG